MKKEIIKHLGLWLLMICLVIGGNCFGQQIDPKFGVKTTSINDNGFSKPVKNINDKAFSIGLNNSTIVIKHHDYTIYFNNSIKAPDSTSYELTPDQVKCVKTKRIDKFAADPLLPNSPKPSDFKNTTKIDSLQIDKGHTFSYDSSQCSPIDRVECFYVSGMYAQYHGFNNGDWKEFEAEERRLAAIGTIHVINGYIGTQGHLNAGEIIPTYMYKAIYHSGIWDVYIAPNRPWVNGHNISMWKRTIAELDSKTGLKL